MRFVLALVLFAAAAVATVADDATNMPAEARAELSTAIDLLKAHHLNRAHVDWPTLEAEAWRQAKAAKTAADTYPTIRYVIAMLREKHTHLVNADHWKAIMAGNTDAARTAGELPQAMHVVGGIGFLFLPGHQGNEAHNQAYVAVLQDALTRFSRAHVCRFIVDLRLDPGGDMYPMMGGLLPLLGKPPYGYFDYNEDALRPWIVAGSDRIAPDLSHAAVAVLIDSNTSSAGEFTAMAFEGRANTRFFGDPTADFVSAIASYTLPDGAQLGIAEAWGTDRLKRPYRSAIVPDEATERGQPTLDAAIGWLKKQPCR